MTAPRPVFDGHNDALLRLWQGGPDGAEARFADSGGAGHLDVARARAGGLAGGLFAIFVPDGSRLDPALFEHPPYDLPLPAPLPQADALPVAIAQAAILHRLDRAGHLALCRTSAQIDAAMAAGRIAAVMHMEGAEAIDPDLAALDVLHAAGLRSLGPVWSRPTAFAHGVPFRHPSDGDTGPGLTAAGRRLVARCRTLGIVVDTSHMTTRGFWDVAEAGAPLVASHSNAQAICASARNLGDAQLAAIGQTGGIAGLNLGRFFLNPDGGIGTEGTLDLCVRHLAHMVEVAGEDHVGLGSDFDGAPMPPEIADAAGLPRLFAALEAAGFGAALIEKIAHRNWRATLTRIWEDP